MMQSFRVYRADPIVRGDEPTDVILHIQIPMPRLDNRDEHFIETFRDIYRRDASAVEEALRRGLPGGTYDQTMVLMLQRKATQFRVPFADAELDLREAGSELATLLRTMVQEVAGAKVHEGTLKAAQELLDRLGR